MRATEDGWANGRRGGLVSEECSGFLGSPNPRPPALSSRCFGLPPTPALCLLLGAQWPSPSLALRGNRQPAPPSQQGRSPRGLPGLPGGPVRPKGAQSLGLMGRAVQPQAGTEKAVARAPAPPAHWDCTTVPGDQPSGRRDLDASEGHSLPEATQVPWVVVTRHLSVPAASWPGWQRGEVSRRERLLYWAWRGRETGVCAERAGAPAAQVVL